MDATAAIRATVAPWTNAALNRDWDGLLAMCTEDIVFAPPGEPKVSEGRLKSWLEAFPVMKEFSFAFDRIEVSGDLATGVGGGTWTLDMGGQDITMSFKAADVFRRGQDGTWRYAHVIWNLDAPAS
jgi:ketosteroid isomerase-like protein